MRDVVILGSTGSIGTQAVEVVQANPGLFRVVGLAAGGSRLATLIDQARSLRPKIVAVSDEAGAAQLRQAVPGVAVWGGDGAASRLAGVECDVVLNGITGAVGLLPTLAALAAGTTLALANKESLVIGGALVTDAAKPGQIVPVDSEHSALAQALRSGRANEVRKLILTASGGPFRGMTTDQLRNVTVAQALAHPTWDMGRVVTINSATLVNKGLELIEAWLLFGVGLDDIQVVVHPQSVVHSMVEFRDGSTIAQCSPPNMRLPIALGLSWPQRIADAAPACDWSQAGEWTFEPLDSNTFPAVELARRVGKYGGGFPAVYNAANEVAVDAFCAGELGFTQIVSVVAGTVDAYAAWTAFQPGAKPMSPHTVDDVLAADTWARQAAAELIAGRS
ncbi:MAG: 1-deoxy-D-xylulose-5-phosphate reductoisomerase [Propionibacteriaceae bacterium]|jgi:1-deoxy-D-xylulose-5-phosphate reductoisomerase|nr:1-deoxy-D-xylulose-5-phosphate reductoisomerase [Propionibacteriaceae bacterium]